MPSTHSPSATHEQRKQQADRSDFEAHLANEPLQRFDDEAVGGALLGRMRPCSRHEIRQSLGHALGDGRPVAVEHLEEHLHADREGQALHHVWS